MTVRPHWQKTAAWIADWEWLAVVLSAPLLMFPTMRPCWTVAALALLVLMWLVRWWTLGHPTRRTPLDGALLVLLLMVPVGVWASALPEVTLPKLTGIILGAATFLAVVNWTRNEQRVWWCAAVLFLTGAGISVLALLGTKWPSKFPALGTIYQHLPAAIRGLSGAEGGFSPNQVGGMLVLYIPPLLALGSVLYRHRRMLFVVVLLLVFIGGTLILTQSRGSWLGLSLALLIMFSARSRWFRWVALGIALLSVVALLRIGPQTIGQALFGGEPPPDIPANALGGINFAGRVEIWSRAWYAIADFPLTGCGLGTFRRVVWVLYPLFLIPPGSDIAHAHNIYLQVALDLGIPGLVAYLAVLGLVGWMLWRAAHVLPTPSLRALAWGLFFGLLAHQLYSMTDAVTLGSKPGAVVWAIWGLAAVLYQHGQREPGEAENGCSEAKTKKEFCE